MNENDTTGRNDDRFTGDYRSSGLTEEERREAFLVEQDMARTRANMTDTLDQIQGRISPSALKERVKAEVLAELAAARSRVSGATIGRAKRGGATLKDTVQSNPLPAAMIGVGAAWLFARNRAQARAKARADQRIDELLDSDVLDEPINLEAEPGGEILPEVTVERESFGARIRRVAGERAQGASERLHGASGRARIFGHDVRERGRGYERRGQDAFQESPLMIGAAALAAGALLGLALPASRREDALMGKTRDGLMQKAQGRMQDAFDRAQDRRSFRSS